MAGKVCLVTGATSGIGRVTARELARQGATVVITARSEARARETMEEIRAAGGQVDLLMVDFASQRSIRAAADAFRARYDRLHVLVNNAGAIFGARQVTEDGLEQTFAVNHIGYFLLTNLLLDLLKASAPARIVNVASDAHRYGVFDPGNLQLERGYTPMRAYGNSKLYNLLFTVELARRLAGTGVTANAVHPGAVRTRWWEGGGAAFRRLAVLVRPFLISPEKGADTVIYLATDPAVEGITGRYWEKKREKTPSRQARDAEAARRLWAESARLTGVGA